MSIVFAQLVGGGGAGIMQRQGLLTSRPDCFSKKCRALADGKRQQQANHAKLAGYLEEQPETAVKRKKLTDKIAAYEEALQVPACVYGVIFVLLTSKSCMPASTPAWALLSGY